MRNGTRSEVNAHPSSVMWFAHSRFSPHPYGLLRFPSVFGTNGVSEGRKRDMRKVKSERKERRK